MASLPPEILSKVFQDLDRNDKLECAVVSQAWCGTALHYLNRKLRLRTSDDVANLFMKLCQLEGAIDGSIIQHLSFNSSWEVSLAPLNKTIFIYILSVCTNLQVLEFEESHSTELYCDYVVRYGSALQLNSLQRILELARNSFEDIPHVVDIYSYVRQFPALRTLVLEFHTTVCLHSLLCSCPQLESLQLCYGCMVNHLNIYEDEDEEGSDERSSTHTNIQLKSFDIDAKYVSQDLFEYLHDHTGMLAHLTINKNATSTEAFATAFTAPLIVDTALPIRHIRLKDHQVMSNKLITGLNDNFHALKRIEFDKCKFEHILTEKSNLTLNFDALHLDYLSIDFTSIVSRNKPISSMCLVVQRHEKETLLYQRASKWSNHHLFTKNETRRNANKNAQERRLMSISITVITVKANTLNYIRMHCNGYRHFNQIITLG